MANDDRTKARERELILITVGSIIAVAVIVAFLLFIKTNADDSRPARSGNAIAATVDG